MRDSLSHSLSHEAAVWAPLACCVCRVSEVRGDKGRCSPQGRATRCSMCSSRWSTCSRPAREGQVPAGTGWASRGTKTGGVKPARGQPTASSRSGSLRHSPVFPLRRQREEAVRPGLLFHSLGMGARAPAAAAAEDKRAHQELTQHERRTLGLRSLAEVGKRGVNRSCVCQNPLTCWSVRPRASRALRPPCRHTEPPAEPAGPPPGDQASSPSPAATPDARCTQKAEYDVL